ncbi:BglG family transcription antiterminator [Candidatus Enterococcus ferrettii]|uniref:Lichenan operon transcriptional antiterminator n=1 Tax=Candidatus Enterococcus ferrettii TaxID=2815324 RepID=A0ABV0ET51_9ENTE|nr:PRD domain-containing protein [Enterococcus sp. 665A]MBO1343153.1 PRD domain-containing protein [Enterococcus sp. 665A]
MKEKYLRLIVMLQEEHNYLKGKEIAKRLGISDRSVRNYVKDLNENYLIDSKILTNKNKGYILTGAVEDIKISEHFEFEERMFFIVKFLLDAQDWITYEEIAESLYFSNQTIRLDVIKIQKMIEEQYQNLKIESVIFKGVRLTGSEIEKRLLLESLSKITTLNKNKFIESLSYHFKDWLEKESVEESVQFFQKKLSNLYIPNNPETTISIMSYLIISLRRIGQRHYCDYGFDTADLIKIESTKEFEVAKSIMYDYGNQARIIIPDVEIIYFSFYLISQRLMFSVSADDSLNVPEELKEGVMKALQLLDQMYHSNSSEDEQLFSGLTMHLARDMYPLLFNFYIENSFITTIKKEYIQGYYMAVSFAKGLKKTLHLHLPENEIGYIAIHFASFIERSKTKNAKIAILTSRHQSVGYLLKKELERRYTNALISTPMCDNANFNEESLSDYDLIISIGPIGLEQQNIVVVNGIPTEEDYRVIDNIMKKISNVFVAKTDYFTRKKYSNKEKLLKGLLLGIGASEMLESILDREEFSTTDISDGIAIPHPLLTSSLETTKIAVAIQEKPLDWGSQFVDLIIMIVPGKNDQKMTSQIMEEIYQIIKDPELLEKAKTANSLEEFNRIIEKRR